MMFMILAVIVIALINPGCNKNDDPYNEEPANDSLWVFVDYTTASDFGSYVVCHAPTIYLDTYKDGVLENAFPITKGVPFVMKGRDFIGNLLGREVEINISTADLEFSGTYVRETNSIAPANPGKMKVVKNMKITYTPVLGCYK